MGENNCTFAFQYQPTIIAPIICLSEKTIATANRTIATLFMFGGWRSGVTAHGCSGINVRSGHRQLSGGIFKSYHAMNPMEYKDKFASSSVGWQDF
ncbi:hypothetical protein [Paenibacillus mesotrionivorans]|uniref:Uncharacterized protein n=1 Tax=Paenibacillus mesotrionivorans TaxID=3160968 RepID=A0ACC7P2R9_9BACL